MSYRTILSLRAPALATALAASGCSLGGAMGTDSLSPATSAHAPNLVKVDDIPYTVRPEPSWDYESRLFHREVLHTVRFGAYKTTYPLFYETPRQTIRWGSNGSRPDDVVDHGDFWPALVAPGHYIQTGDGWYVDVGPGLRALQFDLGASTHQRINELTDLQPDATRGARWLYVPLAEAPHRVMIMLNRSDGGGLWTSELLAHFAAVDPKRYCLDIDVTARELQDAPLPSELECLSISRGLGSTANDVNNALRPLRNLRYLRVSNVGQSVDTSLVARNAQLEYLEAMRGTALSELSELERLGRLRALKLKYGTGLDRLDFLKQLHSLRHLDLTGVNGRSLRAIEGLSEINEVYADDSTFSVLPRKYMPSLRVLHVMSRNVPVAEVEQFARLNPHVQIWHCWSDTLPPLFQGVTRIKVGDIEITAPEEIRRLKKLLEIDERGVGWDCRCDGGPWIELFRGEERAGTLAVYHGVAIRWREEWPSGVFLGYEQSRLLVDWLESHWIIEPKAERQKHFESWPPEWVSTVRSPHHRHL